MCASAEKKYVHTKKLTTRSKKYVHARIQKISHQTHSKNRAGGNNGKIQQGTYFQLKNGIELIKS